MRASVSSMSSSRSWMKRCSLSEPIGPPSALAPLSESDQHQRVVEHAEGLEEVEHAADLRVGVRQEAGEGLHAAREQAPLLGRQLGPGRNPRRALGERRPGRDDSHLDLAREGALAPALPAVGEAPAVALDPGGRRLMRRVRRAGGEVEEERLARRRLLLVLDHADRRVGQVLGEVVALLPASAAGRRSRCRAPARASTGWCRR